MGPFQFVEQHFVTFKLSDSKVTSSQFVVIRPLRLKMQESPKSYRESQQERSPETGNIKKQELRIIEYFGLKKYLLPYT